MSDRICGTCRHWEQEPYGNAFGWCRLTATDGDGDTVRYDHPESMARVQVFEPDDAPYKAALLTQRGFGCTQWQETTHA